MYNVIQIDVHAFPFKCMYNQESYQEVGEGAVALRTDREETLNTTCIFTLFSSPPPYHH